jgi:hypothetical protein
MSNLQEFHHAPEAADVKSRTVVAIIIALVTVAFGVYVYQEIWSPVHPPSPILDTQVPAR